MNSWIVFCEWGTTTNGRKIPNKFTAFLFDLFQVYAVQYVYCVRLQLLVYFLFVFFSRKTSRLPVCFVCFQRKKSNSSFRCKSISFSKTTVIHHHRYGGSNNLTHSQHKHKHNTYVLIEHFYLHSPYSLALRHIQCADSRHELQYGIFPFKIH